MPGNRRQLPKQTSEESLTIREIRRKPRADHSEEEAWKEILDIGGDTVYSFLQTKKVSPFGVFVGFATAMFQIYAFSVFFRQALFCFDEINDGKCAGRGIFTRRDDTTDILANPDSVLNEGVTILGCAMGSIITFTFLLPDCIRGIAFAQAGYFLIAFVHISVSLMAITTTILYTATTAIDDVSIVTTVVVLIFITDFDEKLFEIYRASKARKEMEQKHSPCGDCCGKFFFCDLFSTSFSLSFRRLQKGNKDDDESPQDAVVPAAQKDDEDV